MGVGIHFLKRDLRYEEEILEAAVASKSDTRAFGGDDDVTFEGLKTALDSDTRSEGGVLLNATGCAWLSVAAHAATIASGPGIARRTFQCVSIAMPS